MLNAIVTAVDRYPGIDALFRMVCAAYRGGDEPPSAGSAEDIAGEQRLSVPSHRRESGALVVAAMLLNLCLHMVKHHFRNDLQMGKDF